MAGTGSSAEELQQRRSGRRVALLKFAWYRTLGPAPVVEGLARSCDVSLNGACICVTQALTEGTRLFLEIIAPELSLSAVAVVVWTAPADGEQLRIGMQFEVVPPNDRVSLTRFCGHEQP